MIYLVVYKTNNGLKSRFVTTHVFLKPGEYTNGGWQLLSVGYYHGKKFIDKDTLYSHYKKIDSRKNYFNTLFLKIKHYSNFLLKILLFIFLVKEIIYKFFIYIFE